MDYNIIKQAHSGWAFIVIIALVMAIISALVGYISNKKFTPQSKRVAMLGLIATHIQLLIAMFVYFLSPYYNILKEQGMGEVMKNSSLRLYLVEHPLINLIAIVLITMGWSKHKTKETDKEKFKSIWLFYIAGLLLLLTRIPWSAWLG